MNAIIEVDGVKATDVTDVSYGNDSGGTIGTATITVANTQSNRDLFAPGKDVVIKEQNPDDPTAFEKQWSGEVITKPSDTSKDNLTLRVKAEEKSGRLEYAKVNRPFIEMTSAEMIEEAVAKVRKTTSNEEYIFEGATIDDWESNADNFELLDSTAGLSKRKGNSLYADYSKGRKYTFDMTFTGVPSGAVPGRRLNRFETRLIIHAAGGFFDAIVIFVDGGGIAYKWDLGTPGDEGFFSRDMPVEDAEITDEPSEFDYSNLSDFGDFDKSYSPTNLGPNMVRFAIRTPQELPEPRGIAVDYVKAVPFGVKDRDIGITTNIGKSDFKTTKRFSMSILEMVRRLTEVEGATSHVTEDDVLKFVTTETEPAPVSIDETDPELNAVEATIDRDFDVRNRVTVNGKGKLQATFEDTSSIRFYNKKVPKSEPIRDETIRTRKQMKRRARGFLESHAWEDGALQFTVANPKFRRVEPGQIMPVYWPSEDVDGEFSVDGISRTSEGYTKVTLSGNVTL